MDMNTTQETEGKSVPSVTPGTRGLATIPERRGMTTKTVVTGSEAGDSWLTDSPRVVIVALYNPYAEMTGPSDNKLEFNNFAKVFLDKRPPGCDKSCKDPITGRFLGFLGGPGGGPVETGTLIKTLQLIK